MSLATMNGLRIFTIILAALVPASAFSGGMSWSFTVTSVSASSESKETVIVLIPAEGEQRFPKKCSTIEVVVRLTRDRDLSHHVTPETQSEAIKLLRQAAESKTPIHFGEMGTGLVPSILDPCSMRSKGLAILKEYDGTMAVYSFHNPL